MIKKLVNFFKEEDGATAVEYAVMVAIIAIGILAAVATLRDAISDTFTTVANHIPN